MTNRSIEPLELDIKGPTVKAKRQRRERTTVVLKEYWEKIRRSYNFPSEDFLNPEDLSEVWDNCFIVKADNKTQRDEYFYKHIGKSIKDAYGSGELRNTSFDQLVTTQATHLAAEYERVLATKMPMYYEGALPLGDGRILKYRQILLPLGENGVNIQSIMGAFSYRIYDNDKR